MIYTETIGGKLSHCHDTTGLEVDAIIEYGKQWVGVEIKLGAHRIEEAVSSLKRLQNKRTKKGGSPAAFLCVITGGGPYFKRDDGVYVIPIDCLKVYEKSLL